MTAQVEKRTAGSPPERISEQSYATALMFLMVAAFLYKFPDYFVSHIATRVVGALLAALGVIGLGFELGKLSSDRKLGSDNLGVGLGCGLLWAVFYYSFDSLIVNIIAFLFLTFSAYGTALAAIQMVRSLCLSPGTVRWSALKRLSLVLGQLTGFILAVLQIVQIIRGG